VSTGIYAIRHVLTGREYVGSAVNIEKRWKEHVRQATRGKHHSRFFQRSWLKHGAECMEFRVLLLCDKKRLLMYEQACIDGLRPVFNVAPTAGSQLGFKHSDSAKAKMSAAASRTRNFTGHRHSEESRQRISERRKGKGGGARTPERCANISAALTGKTVPEEVRKKISESLSGRTQSAETIEKRMKKLRGRKMPPGFAEAASARMMGKKMSPEALQKMRESRASLSADEVRKIRKMAGDGVKHREIAEKFGITVNNVSVINTRQTYAWVI